jgi:hypothetical protein
MLSRDLLYLYLLNTYWSFWYLFFFSSSLLFLLGNTILCYNETSLLISSYLTSHSLLLSFTSLAILYLLIFLSVVLLFSLVSLVDLTYHHADNPQSLYFVNRLLISSNLNELYYFIEEKKYGVMLSFPFLLKESGEIN